MHDCFTYYGFSFADASYTFQPVLAVSAHSILNKKHWPLSYLWPKFTQESSKTQASSHSWGVDGVI